MKSTSIAKNTIANYIGQIYTIAIGIVMLPFYLKYLGAEAYGLVGFFTMLQAWVILLDFGLAGTLSRETAKLKNKEDGLLELKQLLRSVEAVYSGIVFFIVIAIYLSSSWITSNWLSISELSTDTVVYSIQLMGIMIGVRWFVSLYRGGIIGFEYQVWLNIYNIIIATLKFVGAFLLIKYISNDIFYFFIYQMGIALLEYLIIRHKLYSLLPNTDFLMPTITAIKDVAPFALSLAYTSGIWVLFTQLDKLMLSHYIPLKEYGYFTLVVLASSIIMQLSGPLSQAILPRMTALLSSNKELEMLKLYHYGTQLISIIVFSLVGIITFFPYELLYAWTGDCEASAWASPILVWYVLGNGILAIGAFQYYLQFAHGNLKYHVKMNTLFPLITLPIILYAVINYGAMGAGVAWFMVQLIGFLVWPPFIHSKFAPGIHKDWIWKDIFPSFIMTTIFVLIMRYMHIDFTTFNRVETFLILLLLGIILLCLNTLIYPSLRKKAFKFLRIYR